MGLLSSAHPRTRPPRDSNPGPTGFVREHLTSSEKSLPVEFNEKWIKEKLSKEKEKKKKEKKNNEQYQNPWARHYQQQPTMREYKPDPSGGRNQEEALELNMTHNKESIQLRHKASSHMESWRSKEKRNTKDHITPRNGDIHEKNEQQLDRTGREGPGQSRLKNAAYSPLGVTGVMGVNNNNNNNDNNSNNTLST
ncbi:unnamed protein product [Schistosoma margrebowiei]|uniref:Uncharacterized protein n=1 Tax=Schistosoma margrebowiei TaxID=48269 RepID=A0A183L8T9_9TREM|nr:unnamed protein product [Schistosoma margrebowiei]